MNAITFASFPSKQQHVRREFGFVVQTPRGWELLSYRLLKALLAMGCAQLASEPIQLKRKPAAYRPGAFV